MLVRLGRWDDAMDVYDKRLKVALTYKLAQYDKIVELLVAAVCRRAGRIATPLGLSRPEHLPDGYGDGLLLPGPDREVDDHCAASRSSWRCGRRAYSSMGVGLRTYSSSLRLDQNKLATSLKACKLALEVAEASGDLDNQGVTLHVPAESVS